MMGVLGNHVASCVFFILLLHGWLSKAAFGFHDLCPLRGQLGLSNPSKVILRKLAASGFIKKIGQENIFLSLHEATKTYKTLRLNPKSAKDDPADEKGSDAKDALIGEKDIENRKIAEGENFEEV